MGTNLSLSLSLSVTQFVERARALSLSRFMYSRARFVVVAADLLLSKP
jgi:hypothetical protein